MSNNLHNSNFICNFALRKLKYKKQMEKFNMFVTVVCGVVAGLIAYRLLNLAIAAFYAYVWIPVCDMLFRHRN